MKKNLIFLLVIGILSACSINPDTRKITLLEYRSKMKAGWLGQMAGVGWGASTEFRYNGMIIPEEEIPVWEPGMINQQYQDDIYVEMTFLKTLQDYGFDVSIRQAGIDFANSRYMLWHANKYGRDNLRAGIAPPFSGHPRYNSHADDIDYQIEADFSGLVAPGMPQSVINLGNKFGRIMNYGDGIYGGQFVGAMYAEAFFETDIQKIIKAGLKAIPKDSQYAEAIKDVIKWHKQYPNDWQKTWQLIENKYNLNPEYRKFSCNGTATNFNIDAKINGAYIVMGLLYGNGNMDETIIVSMRCGMDSDCNPSNAAGILATSLGMKGLPEKYKTGIDDSTKFSFTAYNFPELMLVCEELAKEAVQQAGGSIQVNADGEAEFIIPKQKINVGALEQSWNVDEISSDVNYSKEEMDRIVVKIRKDEDYIKFWQVAGPFNKEGVEDLALFDLKYATELEKSFADWDEFPDSCVDNNVLNLEKLYGVHNSIAYLKTNLRTKEELQVKLEIGSDDGVKLWLNGKLIHANNKLRGHNQGEDVAEALLKQGDNVVIMKITQGTGGWGASLVVTDMEGSPLHELQ